MEPVYEGLEHVFYVSFHRQCNHSIFRLDIHRDLTYLCAVTFKNNDYGERKSKLSGGI